jgi:diguanylate cyclase (GGDEF)-like protein/PAS domain S-box-containing protein
MSRALTGLLLVFVMLTALAAASSATLAVFSWQRRQVPGAAFFSAMMLGATIWCAAYVGELSSPSLHTKVLFARLAYLGITTVPPSWLLFCLSYIGRLRRRSIRAILPFYLVPIVTLVLVAPGTAVPLVLAKTSIVTSDGMRVLAQGFGPWFWVHTAYSYACLAIGSVILLASILRQVRPLTSQGVAFVVAVSLPWLMNVVTIFRLVPLGNLDLTAPAIVTTGVLVAIGLWRLEMFDVFPGLVPVARDAVIMELEDGVLVVDGHGRVLSANRAADKMLSTPGRTAAGAPVAELFDPGSPAHDALLDLQAVNRQRLEMIVPGADGGQRHVEVVVSRQGSARRADGHVLVMRDVTDRVATTQALRDSSQRLRVLFDQSPIGVMVFDWHMRITECNERFAKIAGMPHGDLVGFDLVSAEDSSLLSFYQAALRGETSAYNGPYTLSAGHVQLWLQGEVSPLRDDTGATTGGIAVVWDTTEAKRAEELIEHLAFNDTVTGLPNRTLFRDRLRQVLAAAARTASKPVVALVNLDRFRAVNEAVGHGGGDSVLKAVGERLRANTRDEDTVARWGADEFAVLLPGVSGSDDRFAVAKRLGACFAEPWLINGHELWLTASIGLAVYPLDGNNLQALVENAETAMHSAKKLGGDCQQFYAPSVDDRADDRLVLTSDLHRALEDHEFVVYYQPQVDLSTMCVIGCEALMRWRHPERGLVPPDVFIPLAEEIGLMQPIGEWVLREACAQAAAWERTYGNGMRVAVNLSARQFQQRNLRDLVADALAKSGLPPHLLELEVTETSIMADPEAAAATLAKIAEMGVSVALDDFGTGYSSLTHLRQLPIDRLKIDRSFVSDLPDNADDCAIAVAVIDLGRNLGLQVIAEGVETWQQVSFLRSKGCSEVQGFLFGKPQPADQFTLVADATVVDSPPLRELAVSETTATIAAVGKE